MKIKNSKGNVYYGMHFYPGVAEYRDDASSDPYRIFINEDTIRSMSPTFAGRPIFVEHVDEVEQDRDALRNEADGWVIESFFNPKDGKTWAKFIIVSGRGEAAIQKGFKLSNAYIPKSFGSGGLWNGVTYAKEVTSGEFEHLAIVRNPRYEESRILTPEEFKSYNEEKELELKRLANSKEKETLGMKLKFWKRATVENSADLETLSVTLPKSGKEVALVKLVNDADDMAMMDSKDMMANGDHKVMVGDKKMSVNELLDLHKKMNDEIDLLKDKKPADEAGAKDPDIESMDNDEEDKEAKKKALELAEHEEKEIVEDKMKENAEDEKDEDKEEKKKNAADEKAQADAAKKAKGREHFESLKNAPLIAKQESVKIDLMEDQIERGKSRYGSAR